MQDKPTILIKNIRAVDTISDRLTDVFISDGKIQEIAPTIHAGADEVIDGTDLTLMPSLFDMHVHFRDPGQTDKEDILPERLPHLPEVSQVCSQCRIPYRRAIIRIP